MKVLVTGGAGFIGSHVIDKLVAKGHAITAIDNLSSGSLKNLEAASLAAKRSNIEFKIIEDDISGAQLWENLPAYDAFFHFAAQTSVTASATQPQYDFDQNVGPVPHILGWIQRQGLKHVVYANTAGAFYGATETLPTPEFISPQPRSAYGATKSFFEVYLNARALTFYDLGERSPNPKDSHYFSWASLRLANVYGPRQSTKGEAGVVPIFFEKMKALQQPSIFGDGKKTRDYVYVDDVAEAFVSVFGAIQKAPLNQPYNIGTGQESSDEEVFSMVKEKLEQLIHQDAKSSELVSFLKDLRPKYEKMRAGELLRSALLCEKAQADFSWKSQVKFFDGIQRTLKSYLAR